MLKNLKPIHCYIVLIIGGIILFFNTLDNQFVFDDESVVVNNESIQSLSAIPKYFTAEDGFHKVIGRYYRPIVSTTYNIDYALWEMDPYGFHLTNVIIHLIATLLLFALLREIFGKKKNGLLASFIGALLFLVHPIHTEAVSWVSGRTDSMVTLFFFASFLYYVRFVKVRDNDKKKGVVDNSSRLLTWSLVFYFIGLLSKEMIITMPVIIILFDFFFRKKDLQYLKGNLKAYGLFFGVTAIYLLLRFWLLSDVEERVTYMYFYGMDFMTVIATMIKTVPIYLKLLFFPVGLLYHYNGYLSDANSLFEGNVLISIGVIAVMVYAAYLTYKKKLSEITFCIIFFFISLAPVMNIVPTMSLMAERFLYMTSFALSLLAAFLIVKYITEKNRNKIVMFSIVVILIGSFLTFQRNKDWETNDTLYSTADGVDGTVLLVNSGNMYAHDGLNLLNKGQNQQGQMKLTEAANRFRRAIQIRENSILAHHNMGLIHYIRGQLDSAKIEISKGIALDSLAPDGYFQLAQIYQRENNYPDAIKNLEKLQEVSPNYKESAIMLNTLKTMSLGTEDVTGNQPNLDNDMQRGVMEKRSMEMYEAGDFTGAIRILEKLAEMAPNHRSSYFNNIGLCYEQLNDLEKAKLFYDKAISLDSENLMAMGGLASISLKQGNRKEAIRIYEEILVKSPNDMIVKNKIDSLKALN